MPNLGPRSAAMLAKAGILTPAELDALGAVQAYLRVQACGEGVSYNLLYAIHGALTGRRWNRLPPDEKLDLVRELEFAGELTGAEDTGKQIRRHPDYEKFYAVVKRIPRGRVATYGQVAELAGLPGRARQVGYALHKTPEARELPWQRVLNAQGRVSLTGKGGTEQQRLLEAEGVVFAEKGRLSLKRYRWSPKGRRP